MQTLSRILHICCTFFHITTICIFNLSFLGKFQVALLTKFSLSGKDQLRSQGTILIQFCSLGVEKIPFGFSNSLPPTGCHGLQAKRKWSRLPSSQFFSLSHKWKGLGTSANSLKTRAPEFLEIDNEGPIFLCKGYVEHLLFPSVFYPDQRCHLPTKICPVQGLFTPVRNAIGDSWERNLKRVLYSI